MSDKQKIDDAKKCIQRGRQYLYNAQSALAIFEKSDICVKPLNNTKEATIFISVRSSLYFHGVLSIRKANEPDNEGKASIKRAIKLLGEIEYMQLNEIADYKNAVETFNQLKLNYRNFWNKDISRLKEIRDYFGHGSLEEISEGLSLQDLKDIMEKSFNFLNKLELILNNSMTSHGMLEYDLSRYSKLFWGDLKTGYYHRKDSQTRK